MYYFYQLFYLNILLIKFQESEGLKWWSTRAGRAKKTSAPLVKTEQKRK